jgi:import inner membrane translocase subunit TIM8
VWDGCCHHLAGSLIFYNDVCDSDFGMIFLVLQQEKERAMVNEMVAKLTSACWDKCITSSPGSKFSSSESSCLSNCAQRYMDMSLIIMKRFQSMN